VLSRSEAGSTTSLARLAVVRNAAWKQTTAADWQRPLANRFDAARHHAFCRLKATDHMRTVPHDIEQTLSPAAPRLVVPDAMRDFHSRRIPR
jgi:hypothetical protein